jgi:hypothetical protein
MAAQTLGTVVVSQRFEVCDKVNSSCLQCGVHSHTVVKLKEIDMCAVSAFLTENFKLFLGTFTNLRKATINLLISFLAVSTNINNHAPGFMKLVTLYDLS